MVTFAAWVLFSGVIVGLYAAVVASLNTHNSGRRAGLLEDSRRGGRDIYTETVDAQGFDPERQP